MHSLFLTLTVFLLIATSVAYIVLSSLENADDASITNVRLATSWALVAFTLMLVVAINATCTFEKTIPRTIYIAIFVVVLYNAVVDQFMDQKFLDLAISTKSKVVAGIVLALVVYAIHRTAVWMKCDANLNHVRRTYRDALDSVEMAEMVDEADEEEDEEEPESPPSHSPPPPPPSYSPPSLTKEDKVEIAEHIIRSMGLSKKATKRMIRQRSKEATRRSKEATRRSKEATRRSRKQARSVSYGAGGRVAAMFGSQRSGLE
jgi:hypothetical protein